MTERARGHGETIKTTITLTILSAVCPHRNSHAAVPNCGPGVNLNNRWSTTLVKDKDSLLPASFNASTNAFDIEVIPLYIDSQPYVTVLIAGAIGIVIGKSFCRISTNRKTVHSMTCQPDREPHHRKRQYPVSIRPQSGTSTRGNLLWRTLCLMNERSDVIGQIAPQMQFTSLWLVILLCKMPRL